jgi:phosphoserine phosphatase
MQSVLTLIADPAVLPLTDATVGTARAALAALGAEVDSAGWLTPDTACDLPFSGLADEQAVAAARKALDGQPVDLVAQPVEGRRKSLLVADMESTIIQQEMLDELADFVGMKPRVAAITARAMNGEIDFKDAIRERVALLKDLPAAVLDEVWTRATLMPGAATLLRTMKANGAYCALVSGGFKPFTARVRDWVGFDVDQANDLEIADGRLSGRVIEPILDRNAKLQALLRYAADRRVAAGAALTVGDGANDLPMLLAAGMGVAFHAKPSVAAEARACVDHTDLTALLHIQGYRAAEFVTA